MANFNNTMTSNRSRSDKGLTKKRWTNEEEKSLRNLASTGYNSEQIGIILRRTVLAIANKKSELKIVKRTKSTGAPYISFSDKESTSTKKATLSLPLSVTSELKTTTLGTEIDQLIVRAKRMGLTVSITVNS